MSQAQRDAIDHLLRTGPLDLGGDVQVQRPIFEQMLTAHALPDDVVLTGGSLGEVSVVDIQIRDQTAELAVLFFHGGAYALVGSDGGRPRCRSRAARKRQGRVRRLPAGPGTPLSRGASGRPRRLPRAPEQWR